MRVVVIGAGLQGVCTAYYLARLGMEVTVLERNAGPAEEASKGNGGYAQADWPEVWNTPGILSVLVSAWRASFTKQRDRAAMVVRSRALRPVGDKLAGAVLFECDEVGDPYKFCLQLAKEAEKLGVRFRYGETVASVETTPRLAVTTNLERFAADQVVLATGYLSTEHAKRIGIRLPIVPAKGYSITVPFGSWQNRPSHVVIDMNVHAGVMPMGDRVRLAGTADFCGADTTIPKARIEYLVSLMGEIYPEFAAQMDHNRIESFAGLRPLSADGLPFIGATNDANVFLNTGHGGLGWTQAAGSARALADVIAGRTAEIDLAPFSPTRFS